MSGQPGRYSGFQVALPNRRPSARARLPDGIGPARLGDGNAAIERSTAPACADIRFWPPGPGVGHGVALDASGAGGKGWLIRKQAIGPACGHDRQLKELAA